jgi:beta-lactamase class A
MSPQDSNEITGNTTWRYLLISFILGCFSSVLFLGGKPEWLSSSESSLEETLENSPTGGFTVCKVKDFSNIKPLSKELVNESKLFAPLKGKLTKLIDSLKSAGAVTQASVYIREFDKRGWMSVNKDERYHPASLMKVPLLICILQMAQANPNLLKEELVFENPDNVQINAQYYTASSIELGKKYNVHELLYYMIANSDNNATWLLSSRFDNNLFKKLFADFCLPEPIEDDVKFTLTAKESSVFLRSIYTASCVSPEYSEYAAELMSNCTFKEGFARGFPANTKMWHKFGEWRSAGHDYELHESGVVFVKDKPYLITIMTKGKDTEKLAEAIRAVCRKIYDEIPSP